MAEASVDLEIVELQRLQQKWKKIFEDREPAYKEYWKRAKGVMDRFEDKRTDSVNTQNAPRRRYNMLWANTETLQPVLFNKIPEAVVKRRWADDSPVARTAAEVLERATALNAEREDVAFVDHTVAAVFNCLVPGTGLLWARYEVDFAPGEMGLQVGDQSVIADYVHYRDFMCSKANVWKQVWWVSRDHWWTPAEIARKWGADVARMCQPQKRPDADEHDREKVCLIREVWDKKTKTVMFFSPHAERILELREDPLKLRCFFPCPKPLFAVFTTDDIIPIPYFCQYQDQANELDQVTTQIYVLLRAAKVVGAYNETMGADFQQMLISGNENVMVPITDWPDFMQKGGMQGNVLMLDLRQVVEMLTALFQAREMIKKDLNEVTGIPDMFRGISSPLDAEGTNQLKVQWGASRIRDVQRDVQRLARDFLAISAEIIAEHFTVENIMRMSGMQLPSRQEKQLLEMAAMELQRAQQQIPDELQDRMELPAAEDVIALLRSEKLRGFALDIESDSTIEGDDAREREDRRDFIEVLTGMIERWGPIVAQSPQMLPMAKELIMFAIQPFRAGRGLEEQVERTFDQLEQAARQAAQAPPQPSDMDKALQQDMQKTQMQEQSDMQQTLIKEAGDTERKLIEVGAKQDEARVKALAEVAREAVAGE